MSTLVIQRGNMQIGHESGASVGRPYWIHAADLNEATRRGIVWRI
ncbi:hypothetical protein [Bremerella cremea]|nr:hypothetical protein [Bremerella cremea]